MTTTLLLRIASVIALLLALGHTLGGLKKWSPMGGQRRPQGDDERSFRRHGNEPVVPRLLHGVRLVAQRCPAVAVCAALAVGLSGACGLDKSKAGHRCVRAGHIGKRHDRLVFYSARAGAFLAGLADRSGRRISESVADQLLFGERNSKQASP